jgi:hypothetical protein
MLTFNMKKHFFSFAFAITPNMALKRDARNAGFGLCQRLRGRPLAHIVTHNFNIAA